LAIVIPLEQEPCIAPRIGAAGKRMRGRGDPRVALCSKYQLILILAIVNVLVPRPAWPLGEPTGDAAMNLDRAVLAFAGVMILASVALAHFISPSWLWLTAFVGLNLLQASFTGFCPAALLLRKLGVPGGCAFK
jgi:hypothetical protein